VPSVGGDEQHEMSVAESQTVVPKPTRRWYCLTPDRAVIGLLTVECVLWLSSELGWSPMIWTFLVAVAAVGAALMGMLVSFLVCLIFRWRFQYSIRFLLVLTVAIVIPCSWYAVVMKRARSQSAIVHAIYKEGGDVIFEHGSWSGAEPPGPPWLQGLLATDFFMNATGVAFIGDHVTVTDDGLEDFKRLPQLRLLQLDDTHVTDAGLEHLKGLKQLEVLRLNRTNVTDAGLEHLRELTTIGGLYLAGTRVTDAGLVHLDGMTQLQFLDLYGTKVTDVGLSHLSGLSQLQALGLDNTQVTDAGLDNLSGLRQLQEVSLSGSKVTDEGVRKLQQALPNCKITR
jgi:hypothetical protein